MNNINVSFINGALSTMLRKLYCAKSLTEMLRPIPRSREHFNLFKNMSHVIDDLDNHPELIQQNASPADDVCNFTPTSSIQPSSCSDNLCVTPTLAFDEPGNVFAFLYAKLIMVNFGHRFQFRFDIYMGEFVYLILCYSLLQHCTQDYSLIYYVFIYIPQLVWCSLLQL